MNQRSTIIAIFLVANVLLTISHNCLGLKPEIQHKFREPEKRPPMIVSTFFTFLVASPALLLLTLWSKSVKLSFSTLTFKRVLSHTLLLAVIVCYARFWFGTNMFDTMRYTAPLICALMYVSS